MADDWDRISEWNAVLDESTYYEILGLLEIADDSAVKAAFHEFAANFHPDQHIGEPEQVITAVRRVFQRGAEAYRVLSHSELRPKYDMALAKGFRRLETGQIPKQAALPTGVKSLDDLCKTPSAKAQARKADELIGAGDLKGALKALKMAIHAEGRPDPELAERLDALDLALFASGE